MEPQDDPRDRSRENRPVDPVGDTGDRAAGDPAGAPGPESALRALEDRLARASDAAERLIAEAAGAALRTPPSGWAAPGDRARAENGQGGEQGAGHGGAEHEDEDLSTVLAFVRSLRDLIPPELQRRLAEALRELLLALRALIDWYLERLDQRRKTPTPVEDIPIF
jgi:hypothetical protein